MGIKNLTVDRADSLGTTIDDVLDGLAPKQREQLLAALTHKHPARHGWYLYSASQVRHELLDDGFDVSAYNIAGWRRRHVD